VEEAAKALFDAIHRGDVEGARQVYSTDGKFYLPARAEIDIASAGPRFIVGYNKACALYVRHIQMITNEVDHVVVLRRCPEPPK
jgi:ketosteroid isomerase-like protein